MNFNIIRTDQFNDQLTDIIVYLCDCFSKEEAVEYLDYLENQINLLKEFPKLGVIPRYQPIARQGFRALVCRQNIIFYKINESQNEIILHIIVPARKNYLNLI